ncbi:MAG: ArnT family glycosyltransferase [Bradymonadia bacterium]
MQRSSYSHYVVPVCGFAALLACSLWLRAPALENVGFHNEDVAGITLNADLLLRGELPLVDNLEYKAPGSFYVTASVWQWFGRSMHTLQSFALFMSCLSMLGMFALGALLYGRNAGLMSAGLYCVLSPITDSIDANYGAWMIGPYLWATVFALNGVKSGRLRWFLVAGFTLALAGLLKRQAALIFPLLVCLPFISQFASWPNGWAGIARPKKALGAFMGGLAIGFAPILIWYASQGALGQFVGAYFFSESGWKYVQGQVSWSARFLRIGDGFIGFAMYVATPALLAVLTASRLLTVGTQWTARGIFLAAFFLLSFVGAALGLRFFKGYYLQVLPALLLIAVHPNGYIGHWFTAETWRQPVHKFKRLALLLGSIGILMPAVLHDLEQVQTIRKRRQSPRDAVAQKIGRHIRNHSKPDDSIWVWGRWAWPVYFHANRPIATDFPKSLGVFTTTLTNTWRRATKNTAFDPKSPWPELITQLKRDEPKFIVLSHNENYRKFNGLNRLLRQRYQPVKGLKTRGFSVYVAKVKSASGKKKGG